MSSPLCGLDSYLDYPRKDFSLFVYFQVRRTNIFLVSSAIFVLLTADRLQVTMAASIFRSHACLLDLSSPRYDFPFDCQRSYVRPQKYKKCGGQRTAVLGSISSGFLITNVRHRYILLSDANYLLSCRVIKTPRLLRRQSPFDYKIGIALLLICSPCFFM